MKGVFAIVVLHIGILLFYRQCQVYYYRPYGLYPLLGGLLLILLNLVCLAQA